MSRWFSCNWIFAFAIATVVAFPTHALSTAPPVREPGYYDWRVDSKDGTKSYGLAGDQNETYIWFGANYLRVRTPLFDARKYFAVISVAVPALIWRIWRIRRSQKR